LKARKDPIVIGALGGSGTRVFKRIVERAGYFMGTYCNTNEDAVPVRDFFRRWSYEWLKVSQQKTATPARSRITQKMLDEFSHAIGRHLSTLPHLSLPWGFKVPKSILFLPFIHSAYPNMKFIHIIRNGLDMVYSQNWRLRINGKLLLEPEDHSCPPYVQSIKYWGRINEMGNDYGKRCLKDHYLLVRFEDIFVEPEGVIRKISHFLGMPERTDLGPAMPEVTPPASVGRWRKRPMKEIYEIMKTGRVSLERFGYWNPLIWQRIEDAVHTPRWKRWALERSIMKHLPVF